MPKFRLDNLAEFHQAAPDACFNGADRLPKLLRNFALGEPTEKRQLDRAPLVLGKMDHCAANHGLRLMRDSVIRGIRRGRAVATVRFVFEIVLQTMAALQTAEAIDRFIAGQRHCPGERRSPAHVVTSGFLPDLKKGFLQNLLGIPRIVQNAKSRGKQDARISAMKFVETVRIAAARALEKLYIGTRGIRT